MEEFADKTTMKNTFLADRQTVTYEADISYIPHLICLIALIINFQYSKDTDHIQGFYNQNILKSLYQ